jgi:hypothetical protein
MRGLSNVEQQIVKNDKSLLPSNDEPLLDHVDELID